ncbi:MAG: efflux RND transporter periplasmic adaptor subunit [Oceanospirillaceae bacterium]|nr:efflux RND transporter periplasmic adaptor subunit [Oceanospirillaceae bacterium]MCP5349686.1 efflux RND transporter periplasmic adaptor subunit [Oceanospirillaceae bacterium]
MKTPLMIGLSFSALLAHAETLTLTAQNVPQYFSVEAVVEAVHEGTMSAQTSGRISKIYVDVNDYVQKDALLIQLKDTEQQAGLKQAKAQLAQANARNDDAQALLERNQKLVEQGTLSQSTYDSTLAQAKAAEAAVKAANALVEQASAQVSYTQIRAPYSGIVKARLVEEGESVSPGKPLIAGLSLTNLRVVADIPQRFAPQMNDRDNFTVSVNGQTIKPGKVTVFPYADPNSHSFKVRADMDTQGQNLFPGMWVKLNVPMGTEQALYVPASALLQRGELNAVYVQQNGKAQLRQVRTGKTWHNNGVAQVEILAGLKAGEVIEQDAYAVLAQQEAK